ncbi:MAG: very short patch repair endonuclease [Actinomycetia bacterium]|nr:very short patch repair endonuclease [Actinomycetes bacterium]
MTEPPRTLPTAAVSARYARLPRAGTSPEMALRKELHRRGWRFRVQYRVDGLPRRSVDIAFPRIRVAVFVDGCFWHGCPEHGTRPQTNSDWWRWKLQKVSDRDADTTQRLEELGWTVVRIWEHVDAADGADTVEAVAVCQRSRL